MSYSPKVKQDIKRMESILATIENLSRDIGTFSDGMSLREQIQNNVKELMETSKSVKTNISIMRQNDDPEIDSVQKSFEEVSSKMKTQLPKIINGLKASTPSMQPPRNGSQDFTRPLMVDQSLIDSDSDQLAILESEVNTILSTMKEINALFEKTMQELQSQRNLIISVDNMTSKAADDMSMGTLELEKADVHQKKSRKCLCWIFLMIFVIAACVVVFVVVLVMKKKKNNSDSKPQPTPTPTPVPPTEPPAEPPTDEPGRLFKRARRKNGVLLY